MAPTKQYPNQYQFLNLDRSKVDLECLLELSHCQFPQLQKLALSYCQITDEGLSLLCKNPFPKLKQLYLGKKSKQNLGHNLLTTKSLKILNFKQIQKLELNGNDLSSPLQLSPQSQQHKNIFNLPKLKELFLSTIIIKSIEKSNISQENTIKILKNIPNLQKLIIYDCPITGKQLFNQNNKNLINIKQLKIGSQTLKQQEIQIGINNICSYNFINLTKLFISNQFFKSS